MAEVTEKDVEKQRDRVEKLRQRVADSTTGYDEHVQEASRQIEMAQLQAEEARLEHELSINKEMAKARTVRDATLPVLDNIELGPEPPVDPAEVAE
jgi:hypothetical protein